MRLLIVDPYETISFFIVKGLLQEGFLVDKTSQIQKGVWMAKTIPYDIIILSIPRLKILISVAEELLEDCSSAFFIVFSKSLSLERKIFLLEKGLDEIIIYPCHFRELAAKLHNLVRREKNENSQPLDLNIDDLVINLKNFTVIRGAKEIILRRKEFDLLYFLFRNQGKVLTKINILESVWDANIDIVTNTLEVHILSLRRKIDSGHSFSRKLIHTVYGRGYLFGLRSSLSKAPATASLSLN